MKKFLFAVPLFVLGLGIINLPAGRDAVAIESLNLVKENKSFEKPIYYAENSFIGNNGHAYYSIGQNNYMDGNDGSVYYNYGENVYTNGNNHTYNGLGNNYGHTQSAMLKNRQFPQPRLTASIK